MHCYKAYVVAEAPMTKVEGEVLQCIGPGSLMHQTLVELSAATWIISQQVLFRFWKLATAVDVISIHLLWIRELRHASPQLTLDVSVGTVRSCGEQKACPGTSVWYGSTTEGKGQVRTSVSRSNLVSFCGLYSGNKLRIVVGACGTWWTTGLQEWMLECHRQRVPREGHWAVRLGKIRVRVELTLVHLECLDSLLLLRKILRFRRFRLLCWVSMRTFRILGDLQMEGMLGGESTVEMAFSKGF